MLTLPSLRLAPWPHASAVTTTSTAAAAPPAFLGELALKLMLNATTTGAHILSGTIYTNRMVKVMLTNAKLFHRAVGIVVDVTGAKREAAQEAVLRAIYQRDGLADGGPPGAPGGGASLAHIAAELSVSAHVKAASTQKDVVPVAIMLAIDGARAHKEPLSVASAKTLLAEEPIVRKAIEAALRRGLVG